jgi:hypothetical protein
MGIGHSDPGAASRSGTHPIGGGDPGRDTNFGAVGLDPSPLGLDIL